MDRLRLRDRTITALLAVGALLVVIAAATQPEASDAGRSRTTTTPPTTTTAPAPKPSRLATLVLTVDGADRYDVHAVDDRLRFDAPSTNTGERNLRFLAWDPDTAASKDQMACATWTEQTDDLVQEGFGFRIRQDGDRWRTVTVTKNTLMAMFAQINVHTWDSERATAIANIGSVKLPGLLDKWILVKHLPWRVCARAVGNRVDVKAWATSDPEPRWGDPRFGGSVPLPPGWDYAGQAGWYAGHIATGGHASMRDASAGPLPREH